MIWPPAPPPPNPVPTLTSISPASVDAGGPSFTLTVKGTGFVPYSQVQWNGGYYSLSTTFVDSETLTASVSSYNIASPATVAITVYNPSPAGGFSSAATLTVNRPVRPGLTLVSLKANDLAWDPYQQKIYVSVPSFSALNPNTVTVLDPFTGALTASQFVGSEPDRLGLSDDGQFLYVGLRGASSVERLKLPELGQDLSIALGRDAAYGAYYAADLGVAPAAPHTVAVARTASGGTGNGGIVVYDDAAPRPTQAGGASTYYPYVSLQWGATASALYATSSGSGYDLNAFSVDASGIVLQSTWRNAFSNSGLVIRFDPGTGLVYGEDGHAVDPANGLLDGTYPPPSGSSYYYGWRVVPDASLGSVFFVSGDSYGGSTSTATVTVYDELGYYPTATDPLTFVGSPPRRLIRWGVDGLAFLTPDLVVLYRGATVLPPSKTSNPVPAVTSLSPSSVSAGSANLVLGVSGTGFVRGSTVRWNGTERATTFVSATALRAYVPASDLAAAGSAEVAVTSPSPGGGTSSAAGFTVSP
jgi:hypothetical protein